MARSSGMWLAVVALGVLALPSSARADVAFAGNVSAQRQQLITDAHNEALRMVDNALAFLRGNSAYSLQGQNQTFNGLTQFYNRSSSNPVRGVPAYQNAVRAGYFRVRQEIVGTGVVVSSQSNVNGITTGTFTFNPRPVDDLTVVTGGRVYVTPSTSLYVPDDKNPTPLPLNTNPTFGPFVVRTVNRGTITTNPGNTQNQATLVKGPATTTGSTTTDVLTSVVFDIPPFRAGPIVPGIIYPLPEFAVMRPVVGSTTGIDSTRYLQLIDLMQRVRNALANNTTTYNTDLEANRVAIINLLNARNANDNQYGFSTSNSTLNQARDLAMLTNPALTPLLWTQDFGARTGGTIAGTLLAGERNNFFEDKFTTLLNATGTMFIGNSALSGVQARNDGLFDSSNQGNNKEATAQLSELILQAFISNLSSNAPGGGATYGRNEINAFNNSPNRDIAGMPNRSFLSGDKDVEGLARFFAGLPGASTAPPAGVGGPGVVARGGHVALAGPAMGANYGNFIIVPPP